MNEPLRAKRAILARAEKEAVNALKAFDTEHPEVIEMIKAERKMAKKTKHRKRTTR